MLFRYLRLLAVSSALQFSLVCSPVFAQLKTQTCCEGLSSVIPKTRFSYQNLWRISLYAGPAFQVQRRSSQQFIRNGKGYQGVLAADYFPQRFWGISAEAGYYSVYLNKQTIPNENPAIPLTQYTFSKITANSLSLNLGAVFVYPISRKTLLDAGVKPGLQYNDGPFSGTNTLEPINLKPNTRRFDWGVSAYGRVLYRLSPKIQLGIGISGSYTRLNYQISYGDKLVTKLFRRLGIVNGQFTLAYLIRPRRKLVHVSRPDCYSPYLNQEGSGKYEITLKEQPIFKWRSGSPIYVDDEMFTFRLFKVPGNLLLYEKVLKETQLAWPASLALPDTTSLFVYSVAASRMDALEQTCQSPQAFGSIVFMASATKTTPSTTPQLVLLELLELRRQSLPSAALANPAFKLSSATRHGNVNAPSSGRSMQGRTKKSPYHPPTPLIKTVQEVPVYREVSVNSKMRWPENLEYPRKPTIFRFTVRNANDSAKIVRPLSSTLMLVDSIGTIKIITEQDMHNRLSLEIPPPQPVVNQKTIPKRKVKGKPNSRGR